MIKKLSTPLPKHSFWVTMVTFSFVFMYLIFINFNTALTNVASASEANGIFNVNLVKNGNGKSYISCDCEKTFNQEYPVTWNGKVIANFSSGEDIGVERYTKYTKYDKFYVDGGGKFKGETGADVQLKGRLVGITCAYANTVFGECVGEVVADEIKVLE